MHRVNVTPAQRHTGQRKHYALKQVIGKGAYGVVYKAVNRATDQVIAIKAIEYENEEELHEHMLEIDLLKNLKHENIVKYHGFIQSSHELYILLEYCIRGSLRDLIKKEALSEAKAKTYVRQTLRGLQYLHDQGVIHRDIKAANLLLTENGVVKLADFGVSTRVNNMAMTYAGSPNWMAPEVMLGKGASTVSDIWSLGATVVELLTGNPPFYNLVNEAACYAIVNDVYYPPEHLSAECKAFMELCFQKNMFKRPQAHQLLQHGWLKEGRDKLEQFKEDDLVEDRWDQDFLEVNTVVSQSSPGKKQLDGPYKYIEQLRSGQFISSPETILQNITAEDITDLMFELCNLDEPNRASLLFGVFSFDKEYVSGAGTKGFIALGGIPQVLPFEEILVTYFSSSIPLLVQCGILSRINDLHDSTLLLKIVDHVQRMFSFERWCKWCSSISSLQEVLLKELLHGNKLSEVIMLQLSTSRAFRFDLSKLMLPSFRGSVRLQHIIFKCLNNILKRTHAVDFTQTPPNSVSVSSSASSISFKMDSTLYPAGETLPDNFIDWLLNFIPPADATPKNVKIFLEVCYYASHLNSLRLSELIESHAFLDFIAHLQSNVRFLHWSACLNICVDLSNELNRDALPEMLLIGNRFFEQPDLFTGTVEILLNCMLFALREGCAYHIDKRSSDIEITQDSLPSGTIPCDKLIVNFFEKEDQFPKFITKFTRLVSLPPCGKLCYDLVMAPKFVEKMVRIFKLYQASLIIQIDALKFLKIVLTKALEYTPAGRPSKLVTPARLLESALGKQIKNTDEQHLLHVVSQLSKFLLANWSSSRPSSQLHVAAAGPTSLLETPLASASHSPPPSRKGHLGKVGNDSILIRQLCEDIASLNNKENGNNNNGRPLHDSDGFLVPRRLPSGC
ncbi:AER223Cp [Eremothecium gossypii ATCC 10895]|uniref:non-specific serine/threonine protein kinase n=1 Tax=Eremothecium gossypii (strain ATCC 10895 / CBS 109.51 / FGSC 9923 / NRRL Y-1056) TaxID=284811 RepID=Q756N1_EREGS|nr:AER223Cp [Eremothecium gossypii ATCC 10895]AAS52904.1 AER223Cp [Eremothecium gossypii ATCC 10895]AEY97212.1 FAER223Cp [Eremothecium gossypii FDAG1]